MSLKRDYEQGLDKMNCTSCCSQILQATSAISDEGIFGFEVVSCGYEELLVKRFADYRKNQIYFFSPFGNLDIYWQSIYFNNSFNNRFVCFT